MICNKCGKENEEGVAFCTECGSDLTADANSSSSQQEASQQQTQGDYTQPQYQQPQYNQQQYQQYQQQPQQMQNDGMDYTPISMWGYFGYQLLFSIPCVGFILLLVFSFGGTKNINLRNFSRSYFVFVILVLIIIAVMTVILTIGGLAYMSPNLYY